MAVSPVTNASEAKPPEVPWTVREVWLGMALLGLGFLAVLLVAIRRPAIDLGLLVTLGELVMLLPVAYVAFWRRRAGWRALGLRGFTWRALVLGFGLLFLAYLFTALYGVALALFRLRIQMDLAPVFSRLSSPWWLLVGGAVIAPVVEEIFFRGFVFAGFRRGYGWRKAALLSSALFALIHGEWTAFLPIFLLGLVLAYLYHRSHSLWPGIFLHMLNNTATLAVAYLAARTGALA